VEPSTKEPSNPFYIFLLVSCVVFVASIFGYLLPPTSAPPWFTANAWLILLVETAVILFLGLASMTFDRLRGVREKPGSDPSQAEP
jgi:heme/copper-type cytochrome/quinol oxidase subunit 3